MSRLEEFSQRSKDILALLGNESVSNAKFSRKSFVVGLGGERLPERKESNNVLMINGGEPSRDVLDDADLEIVAVLQAEAWKAGAKAQRAVAMLEYRIKQGTTIIAKAWYFDTELKMVRSKKTPSAGRKRKASLD